MNDNNEKAAERVASPSNLPAFPIGNAAQIRRATADELVPYIVRFVGTSVGDEGSFRLLCKHCRGLGSIAAARQSFHNPLALQKAASAFAEQGWWIDDAPICPKCY